MKFGFTTYEGETVEIKNISEDITITDGLDYNNNKLRDSNYVFFNGKITKEISITSIIPVYESDLFDTYSRLWDKNTTDLKPVIIYYNLFTNHNNGENYLDSNPNYYWTGFEITENTHNAVEIVWTFVEYIPFKIVKKNFSIWSKVQTKNNTKKKTTTKTKSTASNNTKLLLAKCGNLSRNDKKSGIKCVKYLQKFLKAGGYYKGYKLDGLFAYYTQRELKKAQKKHGLPQSGKWDTLTRCYYICKYKYPTKTYKNILNGKSTKAMNKAYKVLKALKKKKKLK